MTTENITLYIDFPSWRNMKSKPSSSAAAVVDAISSRYRQHFSRFNHYTFLKRVKGADQFGSFVSIDGGIELDATQHINNVRCEFAVCHYTTMANW